MPEDGDRTIARHMGKHLPGQPNVVSKNYEGAGSLRLVSFMAQLFAWVLPSLEYFNASPAISTGAVIPWMAYVIPAFGYCVLYSGAALLFAFLLFEDRDLA